MTKRPHSDERVLDADDPSKRPRLSLAASLVRVADCERVRRAHETIGSEALLRDRAALSRIEEQELRHKAVLTGMDVLAMAMTQLRPLVECAIACRRSVTGRDLAPAFEALDDALSAITPVLDGPALSRLRGMQGTLAALAVLDVEAALDAVPHDRVNGEAERIHGEAGRARGHFSARAQQLKLQLDQHVRSRDDALQELRRVSPDVDTVVRAAVDSSTADACPMCASSLGWPPHRALGLYLTTMAVRIACCSKFVCEECARNLLSLRAPCPFCRHSPASFDGSVNGVDLS